MVAPNLLLYRLYYSYAPSFVLSCGSKVSIFLNDCIFVPLHFLLNPREDVYVMRGNEKHSHLPMSVVFIGDSITATYFKNLIFSEAIEQKWNKRISIRKLRSIEDDKELSADIIIIRTGKFLSYYLKRKKYFTIPEWPNAVLELDKSEDRNRYLSKNAKEYLRKLRKKIKDYNVMIEEFHSPEMIKYFYDKFYVPFSNERHGDLAEIQSFHFLRKISIQGGLLFIKTDNSYIAGVLYLKKPGHSFHFFRWGISETINGNLRKLAGGMLHFLSIEWAKEKGYQEFNFGGSRPILNDPILLYKKKWGTILCENPTQGMVVGLKFLHFNESTFSFLHHNPFIFKNKKDLIGVVPYPKGYNDLGPFVSIKEEYGMSGLSYFLVLYPESCVQSSLESFKNEKEMKCCPFSEELYDTVFS